jgi:hypothetical protein
MTMTIADLLGKLFAHPLVMAAVTIWLVLVLHLPYRYEYWRDARGHEYGIWQSVLFSYSYGPRHKRLDYEGLRRLQYAIDKLLRESWALLRGDVLRRLVEELRRWM